MFEYKRPLSSVFDDAQSYLKAREENLNVELADTLSGWSARLVASIVIVLTVFLFVSIALASIVLFFGHILHSYFYGSLIALGIVLVAIVVLYCLRNTMFRKSFDRFFVGLFNLDPSVKNLAAERRASEHRVDESRNNLTSGIMSLIQLEEVLRTVLNSAIAFLKKDKAE